MGLKEKWKELVTKANEYGVPLPMVRANGKASMSATLVFLSFNMWVVSVVGKTSDLLGGLNPSECLQMFIVCSGLYFGRRLSRDNTGALTVSAGEPEEKPSK